MVAVRMAEGETVTLDGRLDEGPWKRASPAAGFIQQDPDNGRPATEQTEVRIIYNNESLYMGVTCLDSEPDKWLGYQRRRDEFLQADDRFMWNIDTFNNQQTGYFFEMNPSGLMGDALRGAGFNNRQWDGIWNAKVLRSEIGWTIEIEIPFRTLNFDPNAEGWGINFQRTVRRKNEESLWSGWLRNQGLNRLSNAGLLAGLGGIDRGLRARHQAVRASASPSPFPAAAIRQSGNDADVGVDMFYSPTPGRADEPDDQYRLRADRSRSAAGQPDALSAVLSGAARLLPRRRRPSSISRALGRRQQPAAVLQPPHRPRANGDPQTIEVGGKLAGQFGDQ